MSYDNTNRGAVWPKKNREKGSKQPHWEGRANIDGVDYWVSAWKKAEDASEKAPSISFAFKKAEADEDAPRAKSSSKPEFDDDIPF